jgi:hypothetical protein
LKEELETIADGKVVTNQKTEGEEERSVFQ